MMIDTATPQASSPFSRRRLTLSVAILTAIIFFNTADRMLIAVLIEPMKADLQLSDSEIGLAVGLIFAITYSGCSIPIARLADRMDRPLLLAIFISFWSAMTMMMAAVNSFLALVLVRIGVGAGESGTQPTSHSLIASYFEPEARARALGISGAGGALGVMFAMIVGGALAGSVGWRMTFLIIGAPGIIVGLITWLVLPEPRRGLAPEDRPRGEPFVASLKNLLKNPAFLWLTAAAVLCVGSTMSLATWATAFFMRTHGLSIETAGLWLGIVKGGASVVGYVVGGYVSGGSRDPARILKLPALIIAIGGAFLTLPFIIPDWRLALIVLFPTMVVANFWYSPIFGMIQNIIPPANRALGVAVTLLVMGALGNGLGPSLAGMLSDLFAPYVGEQSLKLALIIMACWTVAGGLCMLMAYRKIRQAGGIPSLQPATA